jgi:hypothetical protein
MAKKHQNSQLEMMASVRKPMPPCTRIHSKKSGKRGYDRKENKRIERDY